MSVPETVAARLKGAAEPNIDLFNPVETATPITSFPVSAVQYFRNRSNAIYFQDYVRILPKLQLLAGGRYDAFRRIASFNPSSTASKLRARPHASCKTHSHIGLP